MRTQAEKAEPHIQATSAQGWPGIREATTIYFEDGSSLQWSVEQGAFVPIPAPDGK